MSESNVTHEQKEKLEKFRYLLLDKLNNTSSNLIIVAPTGTGKTTAILNYIAMNREKQFLYVSPLRALCEEVHRKLLSFNVPSDLIMGDVWEEVPESKHKVIISTYEKADSMIRHGYKWLNPDVIIIDEFHNINNREAIESLILYALSEKKRLVLLSATVSNIDDVIHWVPAVVIKQEDRVIPLYKGIIYKKEIHGNIPVKYHDTILKDPFEFTEKGKVIMVFVKSRWSAVDYYRKLPKKYKDLAIVFHGGLEPQRRKEVMEQILSGKKKIIITTTALGQGINLPVWMIIFEDTVLPVVKDGVFLNWRYLSLTEFNQIAGRAGRPGYDNEGIVIVYANNPKDFEVKKMYLEEGSTAVMRSLSLEDYMLTTIHRKKGISFDELVKTALLHTNDKESVRKALEFLLTQKLVTVKNNLYVATDLGKALVLAYLDIKDGLQIARDLHLLKNNNLTFRDLLYIISVNPKIKSVSRGQNPYTLLYSYINGDRIDINVSFTKNDLDNVVNNARWIANAMYRIAKVLGLKVEPFDELRKSLDYGVPKELFPLYEVVRNRYQTLQLERIGIKSPKDICEREKEAEEVIGGEKVQKICEGKPVD